MTPAKRRNKWGRVLKAGTFKQGRGKLLSRESGGYCCLGVAAVLEDPEQKHWAPRQGTLPASLRKKYGISLGQIDCLITLNDDCEATFEEIGRIVLTSKYFKELRAGHDYNETKKNMNKLLDKVRKDGV